MLEVLYQDMLNNYKKEPRDANWQNIEAKLNEDRAHIDIKSKFEHFSATPSLNNWEAIGQKMNEAKSGTNYKKPLSIAAAIALLLFAFTFSSDNTPSHFSDIFVGLDALESPSFALCQDQEVITLDIVKPVLTKNKKSKKKKSAKSKQKRLLDIILAKDENIESEVDSALIAELLRPVGMLSESTMFVNLNGPYIYFGQGDDFRRMYTLPQLKFKLELPSETKNIFKYNLIETKDTKTPH